MMYSSKIGLTVLVLAISALQCTSSDVITSVGGSFTFLCGVSSGGPGQYIQIYKESITFPMLDGSVSTEFDVDGTLKLIISTDGELTPQLPAAMKDRYTVMPTDGSYSIQVQDAQVSDSGMWTCRAARQPSNQTSDTIGSLFPTNITVISPVLSMDFFVAPDESVWTTAMEYVTGDVTLNPGQPTYFGCEVRFNMGLPDVSAYWGNVTEQQVVDNATWTYTAPFHSSTVLGVYTVSSNSSVIYFAKTADISNLGARNNSEFVCVATLPEVGAQSASITIKTDTPAEDPDTDGDDDVSDDGNAAAPFTASPFIRAATGLAALLAARTVY